MMVIKKHSEYSKAYHYIKCRRPIGKTPPPPPPVTQLANVLPKKAPMVTQDKIKIDDD